MKQKINFLLLAFFIISFPILGRDAHYSLLLNNLPYETTYPIILSEDHLYVSLTDLSDLFVTPVTSSNGNYRFSYNDQNVRLTSMSRTYTIDGINHTLEHFPLLAHSEIYVPLELLSNIGVLTRVDHLENILYMNLSTPYSRNSDNLDKHTFREVDNNLKDVPKHITALASENAFESALESATNQGDFITFVSNEDFRYVSNLFTERLETTSYDNMFLTIRELDASVYPNVITGTKTLPIQVVPSKSSFELTIGEETVLVNQLWAAYHPATSLTAMDLEKTIDSTLMKTFYTYYRNLYNLKDDLYFEPFEVITNTRTQTIEKQAYTKTSEGEETHYDVSIYRTHPTGSIHYIIELKKEGN